MSSAVMTTRVLRRRRQTVSPLRTDGDLNSAELFEARIGKGLPASARRCRRNPPAVSTSSYTRKHVSKRALALAYDFPFYGWASQLPLNVSCPYVLPE